VINGAGLLRCFESARVLVRFDHVASRIGNAMVSKGCAAEREKKSASFSPALVMKQFSIYELSSDEVARHDF
jgi:hypothetical protein